MKYIIPLVLIVFTVSCTSKNRYEKENQSASQKDEKSSGDPSLNMIKGNITDVESDAKPYLTAVSDTPKWNITLGEIQPNLYDVKLEMNTESKIYFGILKRVQNENNPGEFFVGELNSNKQKNQVQLYVVKLPCTDSKNNMHTGRLTMLKNDKEYYACADFVESPAPTK
ncbi:MAG: hypothetical protein ABI851_13750 [Saprospiraceae bacterium]